MPVYNEKNTIQEVIERVKAIDIPKEILIVDDCSTDGTREMLSRLVEQEGDRQPFDNQIRLILHEKNQGKGAAIRTAIAEARGELAIVQDADLEYDPQDYYHVILPILQDKADVVFGSRFQGGRPHRVLYFWHSMGNKLITFMSNAVTNLNLTDIETCYKAFKTTILQKVRFEQNRFGFEVEFTSKVARAGLRVYEVGISYFGRTYSEGKKITWKDGIQAVYLILKYR